MRERRTINTKLKRIIAFVMSLVMLLTLVAVDSQVHLFAANDEEAEAKEIDVTDYIKELIQTSGCDDEETVGVSGTSTFRLTCGELEDGMPETGSICIAEYDTKKDAAEKLATDTDASDAENTATEKFISRASKYSLTGGEVWTIDSEAEDETLTFAVYSVVTDDKTNRTECTLLGRLNVVRDDEAPEICLADELEAMSVDVSSKETSKKCILKEDSDGNYYYLLSANNTENERKIQLIVDDASGISSVSYNYTGKDASGSEVIQRDDRDDCYYLTLKNYSAAYTVIAEDSAENTSTYSFTVKKTGGITIEGIKLQGSEGESKNISSAGSTFNLSSGSVYTLTVSASETAGADSTDYGITESDVALTLKYTYTLTAPSGETAKAITGEADFSNGTAAIKLPGNLSMATMIAGSLVMIVTDEVGDESYAFGANGCITFADESAPEITISNIKQGDSDTKLDYDTYQPEWTKYVTLELNVNEDNSYINKVSYTVDEEETEFSDVGDAALAYEKELTIGKDKDKDISLKDGEHTIKFTATNYADGSADKEINVWLDSTDPTVEFNDKSYVATSNTESIQVLCSDVSSGVSTVTAYIYDSDNSVVGDEQILTMNDESKYEVSLNAIKSSGNYTVNVTATDAAGNETTKSAGVYANIDRVKLSSATLSNGSSLTDLLNTSECYMNGKEVTLELEFCGYELAKEADNVSIEINGENFGGTEFETVTKTAKDLKYNDAAGTYTCECPIDSSKQGSYTEF